MTSRLERIEKDVYNGPKTPGSTFTWRAAGVLDTDWLIKRLREAEAIIAAAEDIIIESPINTMVTDHCYNWLSELRRVEGTQIYKDTGKPLDIDPSIIDNGTQVIEYPECPCINPKCGEKQSEKGSIKIPERLEELRLKYCIDTSHIGDDIYSLLSYIEELIKDNEYLRSKLLTKEVQ
jgi:hypothetical protein